MADLTVGFETLPAGKGIQGKYHDNGDGTFSEQIFVSAGVSTNVGSIALEASRVLKNAPGVLKTLTICNAGAVAQFFQLHDAITVPADTAVPKAVIYLAAKGNFVWDFGLSGRSFATGIVVCNSTTAATKTIGAADSFFDAQVL
jgi:hypothetical protein